MTGISQIQIVAVAVSLLLFLFIMYLIRSQRLKEEYSLLWIFFSLVFILFSFWKSGLDHVAEFLGVSYPPAALFMILLMAIFLILIEYSVIISQLSNKNKSLAQEIALLKHRMSAMENGKKKMEKGKRKKKEDNANDIEKEQAKGPGD